MTRDERMTRAEIEQELLRWMRSGDWRRDEERFERLALALFRFQFDHCEPYARYARLLGRTPETVDHASGIPPVPTGAFKEFDLRCFDEAATIRTFRTSGTTTEQRGALHLDTLALYDASLLASLRHCLLTDLTGRAPTLRFLAPDPVELPDSSLSYMFGELRRVEGSSRSGFDLHSGSLDLESLAAAIDQGRARGEPLVVAGTAFAFVHLLDATAEEGATGRHGARWRLPPGSRVMETGGFKGRSRQVPREVLRTELARRFAIPERSVINQYGMTELGSQFYDSTLVDPDGPRRKLAPPWTRVRFVDPESGGDVRDGEVGMVLVQDLANTGSVAAIQTADLGRAVVGAGGEAIGFDVLGRAPGAEARGCSIASDAMLEQAEGGPARGAERR